MGMMLLPARPGTCPVCAVDHPPDFPHDATSIFYATRFLALRGRDLTWADAAAHCSPRMRAYWKQALTEQGHAWTEPPAGQEPIADPPHDSLGGLVDTGIEPVVIKIGDRKKKTPG
jgi:hypothetical protein